MGKITEKVIQSQIMAYMESTGQINTNSHAYRKIHSTTTAMLQISDDIQTSADLKLISCVMTLDESAAFDCVSHEILEQKIQTVQFRRRDH